MDFKGRVRRGGYASYVATVRAQYPPSSGTRLFLLWNNVDLWGEHVWPEGFVAFLESLQLTALVIRK